MGFRVKLPGLRGQPVIVTTLGITQTLAWASTYYLPAVMAAPICKNLHISDTWFFGMFSAALLLSGLLGPAAGRMIDRRGGRDVLAATNLIFATVWSPFDGLSLVSLALAWTIIGVGMGFGLYEAAFATATGLLGRNARSAITGITLFAGFASTIGWPTTALFIHEFGWRGACLGWAVLHLVLGLPLNRFLVPRQQPIKLEEAPKLRSRAGECAHDDDHSRWGVRRLLVRLVAMATNLPRLLEALGATPAAAIGAAALVGPAQVGARLIEFGLLRRASPLISARLAAALPTWRGLPGFRCPRSHPVQPSPWWWQRFIDHRPGNAAFGAFGAQGYGLRVGILAAPGRILQGAAPLMFSLVLDHGGPYDALLLSGGLSTWRCSR